MRARLTVLCCVRERSAPTTPSPQDANRARENLIGICDRAMSEFPSESHGISPDCANAALAVHKRRVALDRGLEEGTPIFFLSEPLNNEFLAMANASTVIMLQFFTFVLDTCPKIRGAAIWYQRTSRMSDRMGKQRRSAGTAGTSWY